MQCIRPLSASFDRKGNITFSKKQADPGVVPFAFPCRKCLPCRLNFAREKAIRCWHESQINPHKNIFLTLTYSDEHLESPRLIYSHWQDFIRKLRLTLNEPISTMVTGEYGDKFKRPHWHALIFNYRPNDETFKYQTDRGDKVFDSKSLSKLWGKGFAEYGEVTIDSAGYVSRYAAKKLCHGHDADHDYHPIHRTSSKNAIGKRWIEKYHENTFSRGYIVLPDGQISKIPRYYEDWYRKHHPEKWVNYVTQLKTKIQEESKKKREAEELYLLQAIHDRPKGFPFPLPRSKIKETILKSKFKQLQERLKL